MARTRLPRGAAAYVAILLGLLALVQIRALAAQFEAGFRPLVQAPVRVPYSWDMFAIRLDRCVVGWDPPLQMEGAEVARWHDRLPFFEFDTVFNGADSYVAAGARACAYRSAPETRVTMKCFSSEGGTREFGFDCP